jgi:hypothetical protein
VESSVPIVLSGGVFVSSLSVGDGDDGNGADGNGYYTHGVTVIYVRYHTGSLDDSNIELQPKS